MEEDTKIKVEIDPIDAKVTKQALFFFDAPDEDEEKTSKELIVRLDKWLWAARFFKTRALARAGVEMGKVSLNNQRTKPSVEVIIGDALYLKQGRFEIKIKIIGLSTRRRSIEEAKILYEIISDFRPNQDHMYYDNSVPKQTNSYGEQYNDPEKRNHRSARFLRRHTVKENDGSEVNDNQLPEEIIEDNKYNQEKFNYNTPLEFETTYNNRRNNRFTKNFNKSNDFNNHYNRSYAEDLHQD